MALRSAETKELPSGWAMPDGQMLERALRAQAAEAFARAQAERAAVRTPDGWARRRAALLDAFKQMLGPFPAHTPLNAQVTGRIERAAYTIEKVIFESRPRFYVTGSLYLPRDTGGDGPSASASSGRRAGRRGAPRRPAILSPCGHSDNGRMYDTYQRLYAGLATRGYVVLAVDPLGQGERLQYLDPTTTGRSQVGSSTSEHTMAGNQCLLLGLNLANYMVWDYIRALDYLCSRPEVDPARIGVTGSSGGGTGTAYLAPLDERVAAAVPVCYITSLEARMASGKVADSEQNLTGQIALGLDHAELCALVAPRPLRVIAATGDFFPVEGTRQTMEEVRRVYALLGVPDAGDLVECEGGHSYAQPLREAAHGWFDRWLRGEHEGRVAEPDVAVERDEELWAAPQGQVASLGGETVASLNRALLPTVLPPRPALATPAEVRSYQAEVRRRAARVTAVGPAFGGTDQAAPEMLTVATEAAGTAHLEHLVYSSEPGISVPATLYLPAEQALPRSRPAVLCVHEDGRAALGGPEGVAWRLAERGVAVLAVDVRGTGQTAPEPDDWGDHPLLGSEARLAFDALMLGETLFGLRLRDVLAGLRLLRARREIDPSWVGVAGWRSGGLLALYAAALDGITAAALCADALATYRILVEQELSRHHGSIYLPGVLAQYDLDEVAAAVAPRPLAVVNPVDAERSHLQLETARATYAWAEHAYDLWGASRALRLGDATALDEVEWLTAALTPPPPRAREGEPVPGLTSPES